MPLRAFRPDLAYAAGAVHEGAALLVSGGVVVGVGDPPPGCEAVPLPGTAIVPGLVSAHGHAFQRAIRGRTERRAEGDARSTFWSWRHAMYAPWSAAHAPPAGGARPGGRRRRAGAAAARVRDRRRHGSLGAPGRRPVARGSRGLRGPRPVGPLAGGSERGRLLPLVVFAGARGAVRDVYVAGEAVVAGGRAAPGRAAGGEVLRAFRDALPRLRA